MSTADAGIQTPFSKGEGPAEERQGVTDRSGRAHDAPRRESARMEPGGPDPGDRTQDSRAEAVRADRASLREKLARLEARLSEVEEENRELATKYVKITQQNESLANLYVASHQLHSTLDRQEVLGRVNEILTNLVGAEAFAVFLVDKTTGELTPVTSEGALPTLPPGEPGQEEGILDRVVRTGEAFYREAQDPRPPGPLACVPLKIGPEVVGAIAIFKLLVQKEGFTLMDSEILNLLAGHAATALVAAHLYADAERKLKTIQGFMKLLMHPDSQEEAQASRLEGSGV